MATKVIKTIIKLRRDTSENYAKVSNTFIPANGEMCLVDTLLDGLKVVIGDGSKNYEQLVANGYLNDIFVLGYYYAGAFYNEPSHINKINGNTNKIYRDIHHLNNIYCYDGESFLRIGGAELPTATAEVAGVVKLYNNLRTETDGAIDQKTVTENLNKKIELKVDSNSETAIFF